jgi:hypothetical protein
VKENLHWSTRNRIGIALALVVFPRNTFFVPNLRRSFKGKAGEVFAEAEWAVPL